MDWTQVVTIIGVLGAFAIYHANRVDAQITTIENQFVALNQKLDNQINTINQKLDNQINTMNQRLDQSNQRLDQLYTMFIDLLKEGRK